MSAPASKALAAKIRKQRELAHALLPKVRLCARVVLAILREDAEFDRAIAELKAALGTNWSHVSAIQFMSGRQALFCAECAVAHEQQDLLLAHHLAHGLCDEACAGNLSLRELRALALTSFARQAQPLRAGQDLTSSPP